jgi:peptide/nickel transport system permease protein
VRANESYHLVQDERLQRQLGGLPVQKALFMRSEGETAVPVKGAYTLQVSGLVFEDNADVDAELILYGQVYGLAGTDANRRDLTVALLWGTPIALAFGLLAAVLTSITGMLLAAIGAWYGGWADRLVQFFTEVNLILPFFPVSLMIYILYSKSIWAILGVTVLLSIFSNSIKTYRATFLQIKESPYIEAAQAYGARDRRIISQYLLPRIISILVPKLVILVPSYIFLEATLAFLGVSDPVLPTWGKLVVAALNYGVPRRAYHLVLVSFLPLLLTSFAFAMVGTALEKIFEPRLREI